VYVRERDIICGSSSCGMSVGVGVFERNRKSKIFVKERQSLWAMGGLRLLGSSK